MNRHIVYPGQIPLDTDLLNAIQDGYYGLGWIAAAAIGSGVAVTGLAVTPTAPASLQVNVAPGAIFSTQTVDISSYGSLGTDSNQIVKQGLSKSSQTLTITPPATTGQSQNYLVQVAFSETDTAAVILPYYNASNPSVAWSGPSNSGVAQNTIRQDQCVVGLKAGVPAATGSQTTPSPDAGYVGLYVITVANGQTTITSGNISLLASAPYFPTLPQVPTSVQNRSWIYAVAGGSANTITLTINPPPAAYSDGMGLVFKVSANNTGSATVQVNSLAQVALTRADGSPLQKNDLVANAIVEANYNATTGSFQVLGTGGLSAPIRTGAQFSTPGTTNWVCPAGVVRVRARVWGAGGGGGGGFSNTASPGAGAGGSGGGYSEGYFDVVPGTTYVVTVGSPGAGGSSPLNGTAGGSSSFSSFISATGGAGGAGGNNSGTSPTGSPGTGTGGIINISGNFGAGGGTVAGTSTVIAGGGGGAYGSSNSYAVNNTSPGVFPGGAGGGAAVPANGGGLNGGNGASGFVILEW